MTTITASSTSISHLPNSIKTAASPSQHRDVTFTTARLAFSAMLPTDALALQELRKDPAVMQWSRQGRPDETVEETEAWIRKATGLSEEEASATSKERKETEKKDKETFRGIVFVVRERGQTREGEGQQEGEEVDERIIAIVGVREEASLTVPEKRQYELGYMFVARAWGKGYASEAVRGIVPWWFEYLEALSSDEYGRDLEIVDKDSMYAVVAKTNSASMRVMDKCGFRVNGEAEDDERGTMLAEFCISRADCIV
ncbi:GNAT domain-containing protein [Aspergillus unguis]